MTKKVTGYPKQRKTDSLHSTNIQTTNHRENDNCY